jgi:hypothetical protein
MTISTMKSGVAMRRPSWTVKKVPVVVVRGDREEAAEKADGNVVIRVDVHLLLARQGHLDAGVDEEGAEDVDDPVEAGDHADAHEDEDGAHDDGADDAPEEHAVLPARGDLEVGEDEDEDEDVVDAQAELDEVGGEELLGGTARATTRCRPLKARARVNHTAHQRSASFIFTSWAWR